METTQSLNLDLLITPEYQYEFCVRETDNYYPYTTVVVRLVAWNAAVLKGPASAGSRV